MNKEVHHIAMNGEANFSHQILTEYADLFKDKLDKLPVTYSMKLDPEVQSVVKPACKNTSANARQSQSRTELDG